MSAARPKMRSKKSRPEERSLTGTPVKTISTSMGWTLAKGNPQARLSRNAAEGAVRRACDAERRRRQHIMFEQQSRAHSARKPGKKRDGHWLRRLGMLGAVMAVGLTPVAAALAVSA